MRRVLLAWEIGSGLGHLARLVALARHFQRAGHHVEAAVRSTEGLADASMTSHIPSRLAPHLTPGPERRPLSLNYADVLVRNGYGDANALGALVDQWLRVFDAAQPDLVVLEHAPGALLAARLAHLPRVVIGTGFSVPPLSVPQPTIQPWFNVPDGLLLQREGRLLAAVNATTLRYDGRTISSVAGLFDGADRYVCTVPQLDHYQRRTPDEYSGPFGAVDGEIALWPEGAGPRVLFYGRSARLLEVLRIAIARNCRILIHHPQSPQPAFEQHPAVTWLKRPAELDRITNTCELVVCEAPGTATRFLLAGVPVLLLAHAPRAGTLGVSGEREWPRGGGQPVLGCALAPAGRRV